jgi:hypothetical protein
VGASPGQAAVVSLAEMTRRCVRIGLIGLLCASAAVLTVGSAAAAAPPPDDPPPATLPPELPPPEPGVIPDMLVPVPVGCPVPEPAAAVFTGTMIGKDDVTQTVRFRIDQVRAGSTDPWAVNGLIDVRYGPDYRFLDKGEQYLIGVGLDPVYGVLSSSVRPAEPNFGGNDVVGVDDLDVDCPALDDPVRTLHVDGTSVDSGVLSLMTEDRRLLLATLAVPTAIVFAVLLALVVLRVFGRLAFQGIFQLGRAAVTPVPDHRAVRVRTHRPRDEASADAAAAADALDESDTADLDDDSAVVH